MRRLALAPAFFGLRVASGLFLLKLAANFLSVSQFADFSQFMLFSALVNLGAVGGAQNGLVRQAAAALDAYHLARTRNAALVIWAVAAPVLAIPVMLASHPISILLVGSATAGPVVMSIALLTLAAGPGQIGCSLLTGRQRPAHSLAAQALGLSASTALAAEAILRGQAAWAAIGFAGGGLVMTVAALLFAGRLGIARASFQSSSSEIRALLGYSAATAATASFSAIVMFGLRLVYRGAFGAPALGYWMAANRISDLSTQLIGLFMIQVFVPQLAMTHSEPDRRWLMIQTWALGAATMGAVAVIFTLASRPLVHILLSDAFLPAIPGIRTYMVGDFLRVWVSLALYAAFARGQPSRSAAIEIGTLAVMAALTLALVWSGLTQAPQLAYAGAYGFAAALVTLTFFLRPRRGAHQSSTAKPI